MPGTWSIDIDQDRNLVHWQLRGFFELPDVEAFHKDCLASIGRLPGEPAKHLGLSDLREMVIQAQDTVRRFGRVLADPKVMPARHAVIVPTTLVRSQFVRVAPHATIEMFNDTASALKWLFAFK